MYEVDPETCQLTESPTGKFTRKSAALLAYHLAGEKVNRWSEVKSAAWSIYEQEVAQAQRPEGSP